MKIFKNFKNNIYNKWSPTTKLMFYLAVIGILISLFIGGKYIINISNIKIINSTFEKSPVIRGGSNINITYSEINENPDVANPLVYNRKLDIVNHVIKDSNSKFNLYNVEFILPSNQKAFVKEYLYDKWITLGYCNDDFSTCFINHKYGQNIENVPCFKLVLFEDLGNDMYLSADFQNNEKCVKRIEGDEDFLKAWAKYSK